MKALQDINGSIHIITNIKGIGVGKLKDGTYGITIVSKDDKGFVHSKHNTVEDARQALNDLFTKINS